MRVNTEVWEPFGVRETEPGANEYVRLAGPFSMWSATDWLKAAFAFSVNVVDWLPPTGTLTGPAESVKSGISAKCAVALRFPVIATAVDTLCELVTLPDQWVR